MSDAPTCRLCAAPPAGSCPRCGQGMCASHLPHYVGYACPECEARWQRDPVLPLVRVMVAIGVAAATMLAAGVGVFIVTAGLEIRFDSGVGILVFFIALPLGVGVAVARACDRRIMRPRFLRPTDPETLPPARVVDRRARRA